MKIVQLSQIPETPVSHDPQLKKRVMFDVGTVPHMTTYSQAIVPVGGYVGAHKHKNMWEIFFVNSGHAVMTVGQEVLEIKKGSCVIVEPKEIHSIKNIGKTKLVLRYFGVVE